MSNILVSVICVFMTIPLSYQQNWDAIGFPEPDDVGKLKNGDDRLPVYIPATCPENELYYPGDQKDDWICDCRPANIYHPASDACWPAYRRGPCADREFLVLPQGSVIPICQENHCGLDGYVLWNNNCVKLGDMNACPQNLPLVAALGVNASSLKLECVTLNIQMRFVDYEKDHNEVKCPPGCKRSFNKRCVSSNTT